MCPRLGGGDSGFLADGAPRAQLSNRAEGGAFPGADTRLHCAASVRVRSRSSSQQRGDAQPPAPAACH